MIVMMKKMREMRAMREMRLGGSARTGALVFAGLLTAATSAVAQDRVFPERGTLERVDTTLTLERAGTVSVSVYNGHVNVVGGPGSQVRIRGSADGGLRVRARSTSITIAADHAGHAGGNADLDITVPVGTRVVLEGFSVPFSVRGVKGEVKVESLSGGVTIIGAVGNVNVETVSGSVAASGVDGDVVAESVSGRVDLRNINGDIDTESVSGQITMSGARSRLVRAETVAGAISYDGTFDPAGSYSFVTHSGRLTLALPASAGATVSFETFSGKVDSDFPVTLESRASRRGQEGRFEFRIGDGRSRIVAETFSGDIRIQRGTSRDNRE